MTVSTAQTHASGAYRPRLPIGRWIGTAVAVAFFVFPILYLIMVSFKSQDDIAVSGFFPNAWHWQNYPAALDVQSAGAIDMPTYLQNSAIAAIVGMLVTLIVAVPATHAIVRHRVGGKVLPAFVLATYVAPPVVALFPLFYLLRTVGLSNSVWGLGLVYGVMNLPVAFWLLSSFVRRLPAELEEAATIDGAGYFGVLAKVVVPLMMPGIVSTGIICMILSYNEFLLASFFQRGTETQTVPVGLSLYQGDRQLRFGQMAVASLAAMVPVYLLATFFQRWLIRGLTTGGVR